MKKHIKNYLPTKKLKGMMKSQFLIQGVSDDTRIHK